MEVHSLMVPNDLLHLKCCFSKFGMHTFGRHVVTAKI